MSMQILLMMEESEQYIARLSDCKEVIASYSDQASKSTVHLGSRSIILETSTVT